jgi:hypothetical protein
MAESHSSSVIRTGIAAGCHVKFVTNCSISMCPCDLWALYGTNGPSSLDATRKASQTLAARPKAPDNTNPMLRRARKLPVDPDRNDLRQLASLA